MPQKTIVDMNPNKRRKFGYVFRIFSQIVNGDDTGATLFKAGVVIASVLATGVVVAAFAPYIFLSGIAFTGIYVAVAWKDEYDRNKAEDKKIEQIKNLDEDIHKIAQKLTPLNVNTEQSAEFSIENANNGLLLKYALRDYLAHLNVKTAEDIKNVNIKRKRNGLLPNQNAMIDLIEQVTGFNRLDPEFGAKVRQFLNQESINFGPEFGKNVVEVLGFTDSGKNFIIKKEEEKNQLFRAITKFVKHGMFFYWKANTAMGLVIGGAVLVGAVVAGTAVAWPIILGGAVAALLSGLASVLYNRYTEKGYRKNGEAIEESLKEKTTKIGLLKRLQKLQSKNYMDRNEYSAASITATLNDSSQNQYAQENNDGNENQLLLNSNETNMPKLSTKPVSMLTTARTITHVAAQTLFGLSLGTLVGIAIASVATILLATVLPPVGIPLLAITSAGLGMGFLYGTRCAYMFSKATIKANDQEAVKAQKIESLKAKYEMIVGPDASAVFNHKIKTSKTDLLIELLQQHVNYIKGLDIAIKNATPVEVTRLSHRKDVANEKIVDLIEKTTDLKRDNKDGDKFYNQLAQLLQGKDKKNSAKYYENEVQEFKDYLHGGIKTTDVRISNLHQSRWSKFKEAFSSGAVNTFVKNNITGGVLTVLSIGIPLGFLLFSPTALPLVVAAVLVVATAYVASRICAWRSEKNLANLAEMEQKLPLIERIVKLDENLKVTPAPVVSLPLVPLDDINLEDNRYYDKFMRGYEEQLINRRKQKVKVGLKEEVRRSLTNISTIPNPPIMDESSEMLQVVTPVIPAENLVSTSHPGNADVHNKTSAFKGSFLKESVSNEASLLDNAMVEKDLANKVVSLTHESIKEKDSSANAASLSSELDNGIELQKIR